MMPGFRFRFSLLRNISGGTATIFALALVPMVLAAGGAVDYARAYNARGALQNAIDASVLAGAANSNSSSTALSTFTAQSVSLDGTIATPTFVTNSDDSFTGTVTAKVTTYFLQLTGLSSFSVTATATAAATSSSGKVCILLLNTTATPGLLLNSGATITASDCEIDVKSTGSPAATFNSGTTVTVNKICVAGSTVTDNGGSHANLTKSCTTATDPYAGNLPTPSSSTCTYSGYNVNGGTVTLSPGVYCNGINFNNSPTVTFNPGLYVIKGGNWNLNGGTYTGTGVTFYFADTSLMQFNSSVKAVLSAPTSGTYSGILMYEATGLSTTSWAFNTSKGHQLSGLLYLPSRQITFNAGSSGTGENLTMVFNTLTVNSVTWGFSSGSKTITSASGSGGAYLEK
jgi:Flp pilus assembly protein TadG